MSILGAVLFAAQLFGTLILVGAASGAAIASILNMADDLTERGLVERRRK